MPLSSTRSASRTAISGNTLYGDGIGITGAEYYSGPTLTISGNLIYDNATAGIVLSGGTYQEIINNTIEQSTGPAISITATNGGDNAVADNNTIENNILAVAAGPASPSRHPPRPASSATTIFSI